MSAPSPKRQRLPGSFSPASPPYHLAAKGAIGSTKSTIVQPHTPISPSDMSSSGRGNSNSTSPTQPSNLSPPLSGSGSAHPSTQTSANTALPTPASSVKGGSTTMNDEDFPTDSISHLSTARPVTQDTATDDSASHTRTDHDWQNENDTQMEDVDQLPRRVDANSAPFYYILEEYPIAASVARRDPITGDKINKIRKSYEGKIKTLGISGRNKSTTKPGELSSLFHIPEDAWQATEVSTRNVKKGMTASLDAKLDRALKMAPGKLPPEEADKWKSLLAVDEPAKSKSGAAATTDTTNRKLGTLPPPSSNAKTAASNSTTATAGSAAAHPEPSRPQRANKKRRYDDSSFEGYAEGLNEEDAGYSSPEEKLATVAAKKKRRKVRVSTDEGAAPVTAKTAMTTTVAGGNTAMGGRGSETRQQQERQQEGQMQKKRKREEERDREQEQRQGKSLKQDHPNKKMKKDFRFKLRPTEP
ncbi:MAG: hypothetical protein Q9157_002627 [Trypethelium eluteriae]